MTEQAITQEELFLPLLQFIADHGGSIDRQGDNLLDALADRLGLTEQERLRETEGGRLQWRSTVEFSRQKLIENHDALSPPDVTGEGIWSLTPIGWALLQDPPAEFIQRFEEWKKERKDNKPQAAMEPPVRPGGDPRTRLEQIRESLQRTQVEAERISRNRPLVSTLKEWYEYRCQVCDPNEPDCPPIPMRDGKYYVEAHHLFGLAEAVTKFEHGQGDETDYINVATYQNVIIVCPFHHMLLHYHQPPFEFQRSRLRFVTRNEHDLPVKVNHSGHLGAQERP